MIVFALKISSGGLMMHACRAFITEVAPSGKEEKMSVLAKNVCFILVDRL